MFPGNSIKALLFFLKSTPRKGESSSDMGENEIPYQESEDEGFVKINYNECAECLEDYTETSDKRDWIQCARTGNMKLVPSSSTNVQFLGELEFNLKEKRDV